MVAPAQPGDDLGGRQGVEVPAWCACGAPARAGGARPRAGAAGAAADLRTGAAHRVQGFTHAEAVRGQVEGAGSSELEGVEEVDRACEEEDDDVREEGEREESAREEEGEREAREQGECEAREEGNAKKRAGTKARKGDAPGFSRFVTHPVTRQRMDARDYGYKAWPLRGGSGRDG